jgi:hypothetical protein
MAMPTLKHSLSRRRFIVGTLGGTAASLAAPAAVTRLLADEPRAVVGGTAGIEQSSETLAGLLHASLSPAQKEKVCFAWDHVHPRFGLLRTRVANNWNATEPDVAGDFFTGEQRRLIRDIFEQLIAPEWHARFDKQLEDDTGGFGHGQSIALIGEPGSGRFQFLLTGRHMTLRCDGDSAEHVAFGGPIFYGHDTGADTEEPNHPGNVFWSQAVAANGVFGMLDGSQRSRALVDTLPRENAVAFRGRAATPPGIALTDLSADQRAEMDRVLGLLLEPFRGSDRAEVMKCLATQGGLDACRLAFYRQGDLGNDGIWDCWRLEGPSFVWHFRGSPHVHVWVNIADTPAIVTNA